MISLKVILICFASLSAAQAIDSCVPKYTFSIDKYGFTNCGSDCIATVALSGERTGSTQFVTIDMESNHYEPNDRMTLTFVTDKEYTFNCPKTNWQETLNGVICSWRLKLEDNPKKQFTNTSMYGPLLYDPKAKTRIYFGWNGHQSPIASSLSSIIPYNDLFPDCNEDDVLTFHDPKGLNKITLSKKGDYITVFINSLNNDDKGVNRTVYFINAGSEVFSFACNNDFKNDVEAVQRLGVGSDRSINNIQYRDVALYPYLSKCALTFPSKIKTDKTKWEFDFTKRPMSMVFSTTQPGATFTQRDIKFKNDFENLHK